jgi:hypothetical protein
MKGVFSMTNDRRQAELLAQYQQALSQDPIVSAPEDLDPQIAALARQLAALPTSAQPTSEFVSTLETRLALVPVPTPTAAQSFTPGELGQRSYKLSRRGGQEPGRQRWSRIGSAARVAASIVVLLAVAALLIMLLPAQNTTGIMPDRSTTGAAGVNSRTPTQRIGMNTAATSCVGTLAPQQPATPPARPIPATPTGSEATLYIPCAFERDPGLARAEQLGLVQHPNLTQLGPGGTVTVERFYADTNRIVVAYTIRRTTDAAPGIPSPAIRPTLSDIDGRVYPLTSLGGFGAFTSIENDQQVSRSVISFEATPLPPDAQQISFRLTFNEAQIVNLPVTPGTFGPWIIDLTMPIVPSRPAKID